MSSHLRIGFWFLEYCTRSFVVVDNRLNVTKMLTRGLQCNFVVMWETGKKEDGSNLRWHARAV